MIGTKRSAANPGGGGGRNQRLDAGAETARAVHARSALIVKPPNPTRVGVDPSSVPSELWDVLPDVLERFGWEVGLGGVFLWRVAPQLAPLVRAWRETTNQRRKNEQRHAENMQKLRNQSEQEQVTKRQPKRGKAKGSSEKKVGTDSE